MQHLRHLWDISTLECVVVWRSTIHWVPAHPDSKFHFSYAFSPPIIEKQRHQAPLPNFQAWLGSRLKIHRKSHTHAHTKELNIHIHIVLSIWHLRHWLWITKHQQGTPSSTNCRKRGDRANEIGNNLANEQPSLKGTHQPCKILEKPPPILSFLHCFSVLELPLYPLNLLFKAKRDYG